MVEKKAAEPAKDAAPADQDQQVLIEEEDAFEEFAAQQTGGFLCASLFRLCPPVMRPLWLARMRLCARHPWWLLGTRVRAWWSPLSGSNHRAARLAVAASSASARARHRPSPVVSRSPTPPPQTKPPQTVTDEAVVEEEANEALWQADWDDEDTSADFQTKLKAELQRAAAVAAAK
jgi:hypothetical protein